MRCPRCDSTNTQKAINIDPRGPSLPLSCLVMLLTWVLVVLVIVLMMVLSHRFLFDGNEPAAWSRFVGLLPTLSGVLILVIGLIRYSKKKDRHRLTMADRNGSWSCLKCGESWN